MASKTFVYKSTRIDYEWLNDVDAVVWDILGGPTTLTEFRDNTSDSLFDIDSTNERIAIGGTENAFTLAGASFGSKLTVHADEAADLLGISLHRHSATAAYGAHFVGGRSRGTEAAETVVQSGDMITRFLGIGFDGTDYATAAEIAIEVDGTPGSNDMPGRIVFRTTPSGSQTLAERMRINNAGDAFFRASLAVNQATVADSDFQVTGSSANTGLRVGYSNGTTNYYDAGTLHYFRVGGGNVGRIGSTGWTIGDNITPDGTLHVFTGSAGTVTANSVADDLVVEGSGNTGISILSPDASTTYLMLASPSSSGASRVSWSHSTKAMTVGTNIAGGIVYLRSGSFSIGAVIDANQNFAVGNAALATTATDGFLYIPTCAGAPTGTPTAKTGLAPMVYDSTNNKFWMYDGGWIGVALT